jgi:pimeloyl-ACP methyl ester carboxylesterase
MFLKRISGHASLLFFIFWATKVFAEPLKLFSEAFGDTQHTAILLNAGAGDQGITWSNDFCQRLAKKGFYVIRYDYRDTGLSSATTQSYTIMDLATDATRVLDQHQIKKACMVGFSMGGQIGQFLGAYYPNRLNGLVLIGTSSDFRPGFDAFKGQFDQHRLSSPNKNYIAWRMEQAKSPPKVTLDEQIEDFVDTWRILDGSQPDYAEDFYRAQGRLLLTRSNLPPAYAKHAIAMKASFAEHDKAPSLIRTRTLIIQGKFDPVFPVDHGEDLHREIAGSRLVVIDDMGHAINPRVDEKVLELIERTCRVS